MEHFIILDKNNVWWFCQFQILSSARLSSLPTCIFPFDLQVLNNNHIDGQSGLSSCHKPSALPSACFLISLLLPQRWERDASSQHQRLWTQTEARLYETAANRCLPLEAGSSADVLARGTCYSTRTPSGCPPVGFCGHGLLLSDVTSEILNVSSIVRVLKVIKHFAWVELRTRENKTS